MVVHFILVFDIIMGILAQLNDFVLVVCGECHTSYGQSMCKVLIPSTVCGIVTTVAYMWHSVAKVLKIVYSKRSDDLK